LLLLCEGGECARRLRWAYGDVAIVAVGGDVEFLWVALLSLVLSLMAVIIVVELVDGFLFFVGA
jgi:hypothetical protein